MQVLIVCELGLQMVCKCLFTPSKWGLGEFDPLNGQQSHRDHQKVPTIVYHTSTHGVALVRI